MGMSGDEWRLGLEKSKKKKLKKNAETYVTIWVIKLNVST
jgi:hypothetical protein